MDSPEHHLEVRTDRREGTKCPLVTSQVWIWSPDPKTPPSATPHTSPECGGDPRKKEKGSGWRRGDEWTVVIKTKPSARQQLLTACGVPICGQNKGREIQGAPEIKTASEALLLRAFVSN